MILKIDEAIRDKLNGKVMGEWEAHNLVSKLYNWNDTADRTVIVYDKIIMGENAGQRSGGDVGGGNSGEAGHKGSEVGGNRDVASEGGGMEVGNILHGKNFVANGNSYLNDNDQNEGDDGVNGDNNYGFDGNRAGNGGGVEGNGFGGNSGKERNVVSGGEELKWCGVNRFRKKTFKEKLMRYVSKFSQT